MRIALAAASFLAFTTVAPAQGQRQREALSLLLDISSFSEACVPFAVFRKWNVDWKMWERVLASNGISVEDLDNPGVAARRKQIEGNITQAGEPACDAYISRYGPSGSVIPNLMIPNTDTRPPINAELPK